MTADHAAWVDGLRRGDPTSFDAVFAAFRPRVYGFLLRMSGRPELAEELLQDVFVQVARHSARLHADTRLATWIFTVARNRWRSYRRWSWLDGSRLAELASRAAPSPPTPEEALEGERAVRRLEAELLSMSIELREVAVLVLQERLDHSEIAAILDISPEASRQRWSRARARLSRALVEAP